MRYYSSSAVETTLSAPISDSATSITLGSVSGFPVQYPYTLSLDADNVNKELVEVSAAVGTTLTVARGVDGTSAVAHSLGARVSHDHSARDFRESRDHEAATVAHGATGAVVGTTNTQALTNKDLSSGTNTFPGSLATDVELTAGLATRAATVHVHSGADITTGNVAKARQAADTLYTADAQTVTNKNLTSGTNTFPSSLATLTGAEVLTNKDLTSGTNTFPSSLATDAEVTTAIATNRAVNGSWVSFVPTMATGWTSGGNFYYKEHGHGLVTVRGRVTRSGGTLTMGAVSGTLVDETILTFPAQLTPTSPIASNELVFVPLMLTTPEVQYIFDGHVAVDGSLKVTGGIPSATIDGGDGIYLRATFGL